jgi:16S rRNA C1402 N4-methylase RsmH
MHCALKYTELKKSLLATEQLLRPHGKLGIISFQSDEAAVLKKFISTCAGKRKESDIISDYQANIKVSKLMSRFGHALPDKIDMGSIRLPTYQFRF